MHKRFLQAVAVAALARLRPLLLGMEHYGDSPVRIEIAERWAQAPHLWRGYLETFQYGPLHLTLLGAAIRLLHDRIVAARLLSLAAGMFRLTRDSRPARTVTCSVVVTGWPSRTTSAVNV